jgi:hypothetical protein
MLATPEHDTSLVAGKRFLLPSATVYMMAMPSPSATVVSRWQENRTGDMKTGLRAFVTGAVASALIACVAQAQTTAPARAATPPDLSGFWELSLDSRKVPPANLLPSVTPAMIQDRARRDAHALRWCNIVGMPALMDSGRPLDIRQGANAIIIVPELQTAPPRYLYTWRGEHISDDIFDPTTFGDSIAHWEGDTLVVDTVGFHPDRGITRIPGGGYRTDTSHLLERYRLVDNGNVLSVTFTWTDPKVFRTPHAYEFRYSKLSPSYEARTWLTCDPYNEERTRFLEGTATAPPAR